MCGYFMQYARPFAEAIVIGLSIFVSENRHCGVRAEEQKRWRYGNRGEVDGQEGGVYAEDSVIVTVAGDCQARIHNCVVNLSDSKSLDHEQHYYRGMSQFG